MNKIIKLAKQEVEVIECQKCSHPMVNIDTDQLSPGDLMILKGEGVRISNPETEDPICLDCEINAETFGKKLNSWFEDRKKKTDDDDNDFSFFHGSGAFFGSNPFGGFGGGFGGGGGHFSGGGARGGW